MSGQPAGPAAVPEVAVVGSLNLDLVVRVARLPGPGETVVGDDVFRNPGGTGANQAVAAARLGRRVAMVGRVGDDEAGRDLLGSLEADAVDTSQVRVVAGVPSGTAFITVSEDGENQIVVSPGANARLTPDDVGQAGAALAAAAVTLLQLEVPLAAVAAAARAAGGTVLLNPAPVRDLPEELLAEVDVLVPNRVELAQLAGGAVPETVAEATRLAGRLPARAVVVTLGADGCLVIEHGDATHVPAVPVRAVDTTAAGDAFCGGLADALAGGATLEDAARRAVRVAAAACLRPGAQASLPTSGDLQALPEPAGP
ncbi:MAG TPA: ribokinase [Actinomycetota bacterium]|nr:ribokinase [Actinomycetota bacterium]